MEPVKRDGKIREQIELEQAIRRKFTKKWGPLDDTYLNQFYNHDYINNVIQNDDKDQNKNIDPFQYDNHGDGYFLSKDMYNNLVGKCRCGRPKLGIHLLGKCLQKELHNKNMLNYEQHDQLQNNSSMSDEKISNKIPKTSIGMYGWPTNNRYQKLEQSTRYISPIYDMPGGKINGHPYSNVFIG